MSKRANNEGTIYRRHSGGRWVGALLLPDGGRKAVYGRTAEEARDKLRPRSAVSRRACSRAPRSTVGQWLDRWLEETAVHRTRPLTFRAYRQTVRLHLVPALGNVQLPQLTPAHVERRMAEGMAAGQSGAERQPLAGRAPGGVAVVPLGPTTT